MNSNFKVFSFVLVMLYGTSSGMIIRYKNKENKEIFEKFARRYGTRIVAKYAEEEKSLVEKLLLKEQGQRNLEILYSRQKYGPKFVAEFLRTRYVPILILDKSPIEYKEYNNFDPYAVIDPYKNSFYFESDKQLVEQDQELVTLGKKRLREAFMSLDIIKKSIEKGKTVEYLHVNSMLCNSIILGKKHDIVKELKKLDAGNIIDNDILHGRILYQAIILAINYPNEKNNALELLLSHERLTTKQWTNKLYRGYSSFMILFLAANKDREIFEMVSRQDPYNANRMLWATSSEKICTNLERMMQNSRFKKEHIDIFVREGSGMTTQEVIQMNQVDRILQGTMTVGEFEVRAFWEGIIRNISREAYLYGIGRRDNLEERTARMVNILLPLIGFYNEL